MAVKARLVARVAFDQATYDALAWAREPIVPLGTFERADADRIAQSIVQSELRAMVARHGTIGGLKVTTDPIAYTYEADYHCPGCTLARFGRTDDGFIAGENADGSATLDNESNPVGAVFPWDEWHEPSEPLPQTLACGTCHGVIDEIESDLDGSDNDPEPEPDNVMMAAFRPFAAQLRRDYSQQTPAERDELERAWNRANLPYGW